MTVADPRMPQRRPDAPAVLAGDTTDAGEVELNATAYAIWELCDGETTVDEMVGASAELFDAPAETIAHDVEKILRKLHRAGLIDWVEPS